MWRIIGGQLFKNNKSALVKQTLKNVTKNQRNLSIFSRSLTKELAEKANSHPNNLSIQYMLLSVRNFPIYFSFFFFKKKIWDIILFLMMI